MNILQLPPYDIREDESPWDWWYRKNILPLKGKALDYQTARILDHLCGVGSWSFGIDLVLDVIPSKVVAHLREQQHPLFLG